MGRLSPTVPSTGTDMSSFEDAYHDDPWCHMVEYHGDRVCLCGKVAKYLAPHNGAWMSEICSGCGKPNCPDCQMKAWEINL